jgi:hypothetical protein
VGLLPRQVVARTAALALLLAGLAGGVRLGHADEPAGDPVAAAVQIEADDLQLLKARQNDHAAARARQRVAESHAAGKATDAARVAAGHGRTLRTAVAAKKKADEARKKAGGYTGTIPGSCHEYVGNRAVGCALLLDAGFPIAEFPCLNKLWNKESGWNARAENKGSGAYGIPQALPGRKMSSAGSDWRTNPATQIRWGLDYIKGRYHTPCRAWSTSESTGAY